MTNRTFAIIKPDAVKNRYTGKIYDRILQTGFTILSAKLLKMTLKQAEGFYAVHTERPFYGELTRFMSSGACMVPPPMASSFGACLEGTQLGWFSSLRVSGSGISSGLYIVSYGSLTVKGG